MRIGLNDRRFVSTIGYYIGLAYSKRFKNTLDYIQRYTFTTFCMHVRRIVMIMLIITVGTLYLNVSRLSNGNYDI